MDDYPFELEDFDPEVDTITSELIELELDTTDRSVARRASLQILYELDTTKHPLGQVLLSHIEERPESSPVRRIITTIVQGVTENVGVIDRLIHKYATEWPIDQVAIIDRNILRIAVYEYVIQQRAPIPVIINEAVHLAMVFGAENTHSFVHGVLGAMMDSQVLETNQIGDDEVSAS